MTRLANSLCLSMVLGWALLIYGVAQAACEDSPARRVNWMRCDKEGAELRGADQPPVNACST